ncbi:MAG: dienelactone hydrolase family protein [Pseudomonadota bacterium]
MVHGSGSGLAGHPDPLIEGNQRKGRTGMRYAATKRLLALGALILGATTASCGVPGERVSVPTRAGYDFADFQSAPSRGPTIVGSLVLPSSGPVRGAAILSHGAGGTGARQERAARRLAELGVAALVLDHFGARGVRSVARDQLRVTEQQMAADIFAARDILSERLDLPPDRIGAIGWSKGATAVTLAAVGRLGGLVSNGGEPLAFAAAYYPFCGFRLDDEPLATPLLMLLAGADDWTPSAPCLRQARSWSAEGQLVSWELYENAAHGFDSRSGRFQIDSAVTVRETGPGCTLEVDALGRTVTLDGFQALDSPEARRRFLTACGVRGVTFAGDDAAGAASLTRLTAFIRQALP